MPAATVTARWAAGFSAHFAPENRVLQPGDEAQVPVHEAVGSEQWEIVGGKKAIDAALKELANLEEADGGDQAEAPPTVKELRAQLKEAGLPTTGKRDELVARLADASQQPDPAPPDAADEADEADGGDHTGDQTSTEGDA